MADMLNMRDMLFQEMVGRYGSSLTSNVIDAAVFRELGGKRDVEWRGRTGHTLNQEYQQARRGVIRRLETE